VLDFNKKKPGKSFFFFQNILFSMAAERLVFQAARKTNNFLAADFFY